MLWELDEVFSIIEDVALVCVVSTLAIAVLAYIATNWDSVIEAADRDLQRTAFRRAARQLIHNLRGWNDIEMNMLGRYVKFSIAYV
jgi:hypothetical protein